MKRPAFLIFVNAMILVVVLALLTQSLFAVQRKAQARAVTGRVEIQRGGSGHFRLLSSGDFILSGDSVRTSGNGSAELLWATGTSWKLMPHTLVKVRRAISGNAHRPEHSLLELSQGKLLVHTAPSLPHALRFEVRTPSGLSRAQEAGSIFSVQVRAGETQARVYKGTLSLFNKAGQKVVVAEGEVGSAHESSVETQLDHGSQNNSAVPRAVAQASLHSSNTCAPMPR